MDAEYIVPKLLSLCKVMYEGEPFAKFNEKRNVYIFGCIRPFGIVVKNIVHPSVAIYLAVQNLPKRRRNERD